MSAVLQRGDRIHLVFPISPTLYGRDLDAKLDEFRQGIAENQARRAAMTQTERDTEDAEWQARREAERLQRICPHCGCDPDEHGGY